MSAVIAQPLQGCDSSDPEKLIRSPSTLETPTISPVNASPRHSSPPLNKSLITKSASARCGGGGVLLVVVVLWWWWCCGGGAVVLIVVPVLVLVVFWCSGGVCVCWYFGVLKWLLRSWLSSFRVVARASC